MHAISRITRAALTLATVGALMSPATMFAQGLVSAGVGIGGGVGDRNRDNSGSDVHALGFVQVHPPLIPVAVRVDALFSKVPSDGAALSLMGDAVFIAPLPVVQPYALVGYGRYGVGRDGVASGWNAGVGVRLRLPAFALFGEARRHQKISRDLLTIGVVL
jgi:hypothetical protein